MPEGDQFEFWDDRTEYSRVYHVAIQSPAASDDNPGTAERPFRSIARAATVLQPGEKTIVHGGIYRECVRPVRGGTDAAHMIAYEAARGEEVRILGSEAWTPRARPSTGGGAPEKAGNGAFIWVAELPVEKFAPGYNPFLANNVFLEVVNYAPGKWTQDELMRFHLRRGMIFVNGQPLRQVHWYRDLATTDGAFWVEETGQRIHWRLRDDADPVGAVYEISAREQAFAPSDHGLGYIRVSGFRMGYAGNGVPVPQRGLLSANRGHHWIVEDNALQWANTVGMDLGLSDWKISNLSDHPGGHIVRRNRISDCGVCGIAGVGNMDRSLIEDNLVERIGFLNIERAYESAGLKFHVCRGALIRRNVFRDIKHAGGLWLDVMNRNCRVSANLFLNIETITAAAYIECSSHPNAIDHNVFWNIRDEADPRLREPELMHRGIACHIDTGDKAMIAHNFFGNVPDYYAVVLSLAQSARVIEGRVGTCRGHQVLNNLFFGTPRRILMGRAENNRSDGNVFDLRDDSCSFCVQTPAPQQLLDLAGWRDNFGNDTRGLQTALFAEMDPETLTLRFRMEGAPPAGVQVDFLKEGAESALSGPFVKSCWQTDGKDTFATWTPCLNRSAGRFVLNPDP